MIYRILADVVVVIHFLWILFLIFGAIWGRRYRIVKLVHISGLAFAAVIEVLNWYCPLTYLEVWFRSMHDPSLAYTGSFIAYYMEKLIYVEIPRGVAAMLTVLLLLLNVWLYMTRKRSLGRL